MFSLANVWYNADRGQDPATTPLRLVHVKFDLTVSRQQKDLRLARTIICNLLEPELAPEHRGKNMSAIAVAEQTPYIRAAFCKVMSTTLSEGEASIFSATASTIYDRLHPRKRAADSMLH